MYARALTLTGPVATLIERDNNIPSFRRLSEEASLAAEKLKAASVHQVRQSGAIA